MTRIRVLRIIYWWTMLLLVMLSSGGSFCAVVDAAAAAAAEEEEMVNVIIGFASSEKRDNFANRMKAAQAQQRSSSGSPPIVSKVLPFKRTSTVAVTISASELQRLQEQSDNNNNNNKESSSSDGILYIQPDYEVQLYQKNDFGQEPADNSNEVLPYGILAVLQAETLEEVFSNIPQPPPVTSDGDCFRVCVVDTGLFVGHPDIPFDLSEENNFRLTGSQFGLPPDQFWYNPVLSASAHGTHVAGTIFAEGQNNEGVVGVIPDPQGFCLSIARVFSEGEGSTSTSAINAGVEWCADQGSKVINLSLGRVGDPDAASSELYQSLWEDDGVLIVAAAGNGGDDPITARRKSYPASYKTVLSVGAVGMTNDLAGFSQRNDALDLAAPGQDVLSTVGGITVTISDSNVFSNITGIGSRLMQFSPVIEPDGPLAGSTLEWEDCAFAFDVCEKSMGKACMIERGTTFFWEKAVNCQEGGGILALIYNNVPGQFGGSLSEENADKVQIPVLSLSREDGLRLLGGSKFIDIDVDPFGYTPFSGTSMAAPHVAGVAARIWAARPACTNTQVQEALFATAMDLGTDGRDDSFGHGLVQGLDAYNYLLSFEEPCGLVPRPSSSPSETPSGSPSETPTGPPSASPSEQPSRLPSESPTGIPTISPMPTESPNLRSLAVESPFSLRSGFPAIMAVVTSLACLVWV